MLVQVGLLPIDMGVFSFFSPSFDISKIRTSFLFFQVEPERHRYRVCDGELLGGNTGKRKKSTGRRHSLVDDE